MVLPQLLPTFNDFRESRSLVRPTPPCFDMTVEVVFSDFVAEREDLALSS